MEILHCSSTVSIRSYSFLVSSNSFLRRSLSSLTICSFSSLSLRSFSILSFSMRNTLTSKRFNSPLYRRYFLATSDCFSKGPTCFSSSDKMSLTRERFSLSAANDFSVAALFFLYLTIPAASSKSSRLSSGFPERIRSTCPCPIIE